MERMNSTIYSIIDSKLLHGIDCFGTHPEKSIQNDWKQFT